MARDSVQGEKSIRARQTFPRDTEGKTQDDDSRCADPLQKRSQRRRPAGRNPM